MLLFCFLPRKVADVMLVFDEHLQIANSEDVQVVQPIGTVMQNVRGRRKYDQICNDSSHTHRPENALENDASTHMQEIRTLCRIRHVSSSGRSRKDGRYLAVPFTSSYSSKLRRRIFPCLRLSLLTPRANGRHYHTACLRNSFFAR